MKTALDHGDYSLYMPARGPLDCLKEICRFENARLPQKCSKYGPDSFALNSGAIRAFARICEHILNLGDEVAFPSTSYFSLSSLVEERYTPRPFEFRDFNFDFASFKKVITESTKLVWLCQPNNPTGLYISDSDFLKIIEYLNERKIWLLLDESCDNFQMEAKSWIPPNITSQNVIRIKSFAKDLNLAGIRLGYTIADPALISALNYMTPILDGNPPTIAIRAITAHFHELFCGADQNHNIQYELNHKKIQESFNSLKVAIVKADVAKEIVFPEACYYLLVKLKSDKSSDQFFLDLINNTGNIVVPGTVFGYPIDECWVRICFARETFSLEKLVLDIKSQL